MEVAEIWYRINSSERQVYDTPFLLEGYSRATIQFGALDVLGNEGVTRQTTVQLDGTAPGTTYAINGTKLQSGEQIFLGEDATISISGSDNTTGLAAIRYSINSENMQTYRSLIEFASSGPKTLRFRAVDHLGNAETVHTEELVYDETPPQISLSFSESPVSRSGGQVEISPGTLITIKSRDEHMEVKSVQYNIDGTDYSTYFKQVPFTETGNYTLAISVTDLMGNSIEREFNIVVGN